MDLNQIREALNYGDINMKEFVLFAEAGNPEKKKQIIDHPFYKDALQVILNEADKYFQEPVRSLRFSDYRILDTTGSRKEYEREYFAHRGRLNTFALLSLIYGDEKYIVALEDAIWAICDEYSWCLPAHLGGESLKVLSKSGAFDHAEKNRTGCLRSHEHNVDLFAAETGFALAEITGLLADKLAPLVVHRARKLVKERILEPYSEINSMFSWETSTNNWAAVCAGSVGAAALYMIKDSAALVPVLHRLLSTMDCFLSGYAEDGACTEGIAYWGYGFGFYTYFAELLRRRTAGKIDLMNGEKVKQIALFQQKCYLNGDKVVSFSDADISSKFHPGLTYYLKSRFNEVEIPEILYRSGFTDDHCYRWCHESRNLFWSDPGMEGSVLQDNSYYLEDAQWIISRKNLGNSIVAFAAKGGHNDEPHNHNDIGSFILHINGESLLTDTGKGEYTKQYFGPERYSYFCNSSRGHSVPVVNGRNQLAGKKYGAGIQEVYQSQEKDVFSIDISGAYGNGNLQSLVRKFIFDKKGKPGLRLDDEYKFNSGAEPVIERFISFFEPQYVSPGKVRVKAGCGTVNVVFDPEMLDYSMEKNVFIKHNAEPEDVYCMDFKVKKTDRNFCVQFLFDIEV